MRRKPRSILNFFLFLTLISISGMMPAFSQTFAIIAPDATVGDTAFAVSMRKAMATRVAVLDLTLSDSAFRAVPSEDPFNLSSETAKNIGNSIGCRFYLLVRTGLQRRSSSERHEYFEAFAVYYLVSSLTGSLTRWSLEKFEENTPEQAMKKLEASIPETAQALIDAALAADIRERVSEEGIAIEDASDASNDTRPPLPYRRLRPEYTQLADFYNVAATVDIEVDVSAEGKILRTAVVRWAGYGLDESVDRTVREMQWRPADRKGVTLPMRVLLRYNFRDLEDEEK
jgi:hypothetical protein